MDDGSVENVDDGHTDRHHWPEPTVDQIEVLLLGSYHMDNPGLNVFTLEGDDVLAPKRQRELAELVDRVEEWRPDLVALEHPYDGHDELNELYEAYRSNEVAYDEELATDPVDPNRERPVSGCRNETVQVGFRLAGQLGLECVHAVDYPLPMNADFEADEIAELGLDMGRMQTRAMAELDGDLSDPAARKRELEAHLLDSTIAEQLAVLNRESNLRLNHELLFASTLAGAEERYVGSRILSAWYERNLRILENLWRAADGETDRIVLLIGTGHVCALRHLLVEAPMFCPKRALSVLDDTVT